MSRGFGMGPIMPAAMQTATLGVDRQFAGVASAMVNTSQQVGGSIGTALLNTLAATAATDYLASHTPVTAVVAVDAAIASYATAYWWGAGFFAVGAVISVLLFRRRSQGLSLANAHLPTPAQREPVLPPWAPPAAPPRPPPSRGSSSHSRENKLPRMALAPARTLAGRIRPRARRSRLAPPRHPPSRPHP